MWNKRVETHANDPSLVSHLGDVFVKVREGRGQSTDSSGVHAPFFGEKKGKKEKKQEKQESKGQGASEWGSGWSPGGNRESTSIRGRGGGRGGVSGITRHFRRKCAWRDWPWV